MALSDGVKLSIKGVDPEKLRFTSVQLQEVVGPMLPTLVATYIAGTEDYPLSTKEVELTLTYSDRINLTFPANVDQIDFGKNDVIIYFTVSNSAFYQESKSHTFLSLDEAIRELYTDGVLIKEVTDTTPIEYNQVSTTDAKTLFKVLASLPSPSCYSFNLGRLKITDLNNPKPTVIIPESGHNYVVDSTDNSIYNGKIKRLPYYRVPILSIDGKETKSLVSWGDKSIFVNTACDDLLTNVMDNSKFYDAGNHMIRVTFKFLPDFMCGDIITIKLGESDALNYLVVERLAVLKEDVEVSTLLKPI